MFVKDPVRSYEESFDVHLQEYSPLIDMGDPSIKDKDSSRSDIGAYGGEGGESYSYLNLAPEKPKGFKLVTADSVNGLILRWDENNEADFREYQLYRALTSSIEPTSQYYYASVTDTVFTDTMVSEETDYYYVLTAIDSSGNESQPTGVVNGILTGVKSEGERKTTWHLEQNYPNPFNPETRIKYYLKSESYVLLEILDIKGERVRKIVDSIQSTGEHSVIFDGTHLASGIYFYRLQVFDEKGKIIYSQGNKMVLLK